MRIFVGNLRFSVTDDGLFKLFEQFGNVQSARVVTERDTNRSRGFGFVEMEEEGGRRAIEELDGSQHDGRALTVTQAKPKDRRPRMTYGE